MTVAAEKFRKSHLANYSAYLIALDRVLTEAKVEMNSRFRAKAGCAKYTRIHSNKTVINMEMMFSEPIFARISDEEKQDTISHEMAHLIEVLVYFDSGHTSRWQRIHYALGGSGKRCMEGVDTTGLRNQVKRVKIIDSMNSKEYQVTPNKYKKLVACYPYRFKMVATCIYEGPRLVRMMAAS